MEREIQRNFQEPINVEQTAESIVESSATYKMAVHHLKEKKFEEAERILKELLKTENCFEVLEALATTLYNLQAWEECAHYAQQALMLGEGFRDQRFTLLKFLGNSLLRLGDLDGSQEAYEKAFLIFPGSDILQVNFGTLYIQRNDWDQATACFRQALFLNGDNDMAWVGLALCHRQRGDFELAFGNIERALDANQMNETALSLLLDWCGDLNEFKRVVARFVTFVDEGGFSAALSEAFIQKARYFGAEKLAQWEEFHLSLRGDPANA